MHLGKRSSLLALATLAAACSGEPASTVAPTEETPGFAFQASAAKSSDELPTLATATTLASRGGNFDITLRKLVPLSPSQDAVFEAAAQRWENLIVGDLGDIGAVGGGTILPPSFCFGGTPAVTGLIDDLLIDVIVFPIDGPGEILGAAGWCAARVSDNLPAYGVMIFDADDLDFMDEFGVLDEVITHEMGHVLGVGPLWDDLGLLGGTTASPVFLGAHATAKFRTFGAKGPLPVEGDYGPGTAFAHWDEETFGTELMTGFVGLGDSPLSTMTAASLKDLGYKAAPVGEAYELPAPVSFSVAAAMATAGTNGVHIAARERRVAPVAMIK